MEFTLFNCPKCLHVSFYTLPEMLDHHFLAHETILPKDACIDRLKYSQSTIGYTNKKSWVDIKGESHNASKS